MKNVITKRAIYGEYSYFTHIYFLNVDYDFNEKSIEEVVNFVNEDPFSDVMIHANDLTIDVINTIKEISKIKRIWFQTDHFLYEDFAIMDKENLETLGIDRISIIIDAIGDIIDLKETLIEEELVKFNYMELPF